LEDIRTYSTEMWGVDRATDYLEGLFDVFDLIAATPKLGRLRTNISPPVRLHPYGSHNILYRDGETAIEIMRVLHGRQNWGALLED
jgi:toxin ParE1/3/4